MSYSTSYDQRVAVLDGRILSATDEIAAVMDGDHVGDLFHELEAEHQRGFWIWEGHVDFVGPGWAGSEPIDPDVQFGGEFRRGALNDWIALHPNAPQVYETVAHKVARHGTWPPATLSARAPAQVLGWDAVAGWRVVDQLQSVKVKLRKGKTEGWASVPSVWPAGAGAPTHWVLLPAAPTEEWPPAAPITNVEAVLSVLLHRTPTEALEAGLMYCANVAVDLTRDDHVTVTAVGYLDGQFSREEISLRAPERPKDPKTFGMSGDAWLSTFTGGRFDLVAEQEVRIEDLAHGLAFTCRYGGQCVRFYSVAEHCVKLTRWIMENREGCDGPMALSILLHDVDEAILPDLPSPVKALGARWVDEFKAFGRDLRRRIFEALGVPEPPDWLKEFDRRIIADEMFKLFKPDEGWTIPESEALGVELEFWSPHRAEVEFLRLYRELNGEPQQLAFSAVEFHRGRRDPGGPDSEIVTISRTADGVACSCGGYARRAECTEWEIEQHGCGRDRIGNECCARAFVCVLCGRRHACSAEAPDMEDF